jgi:hypothetical protein
MAGHLPARFHRETEPLPPRSVVPGSQSARSKVFNRNPNARGYPRLLHERCQSGGNRHSTETNGRITASLSLVDTRTVVGVDSARFCFVDDEGAKVKALSIQGLPLREVKTSSIPSIRSRASPLFWRAPEVHLAAFSRIRLRPHSSRRRTGTVRIANAPGAELPTYFSDIYQHIDNDSS